MKPPKYLSGEEVRTGDRVLFHGGPGQVEFVVTGLTGDAGRDWYVQEHPDGGVMITAEEFGRVFLPTDSIDERLSLVSRGA